MDSFDAWLRTDDSSGGEYRYAVSQWGLIQLNPKSIQFVRGSQTLAAQLVSVQYSNDESEINPASGAQTAKREVIVFGVKGHPSDDVPDTDIRRGDQFALNGRILKVTDVIENLGSVQAWTEAMS